MDATISKRTLIELIEENGHTLEDIAEQISWGVQKFSTSSLEDLDRSGGGSISDSIAELISVSIGVPKEEVTASVPSGASGRVKETEEVIDEEPVIETEPEVEEVIPEPEIKEPEPEIKDVVEPVVEKAVEPEVVKEVEPSRIKEEVVPSPKDNLLSVNEDAFWGGFYATYLLQKQDTVATFYANYIGIDQKKITNKDLLKINVAMHLVGAEQEVFGAISLLKGVIDYIPKEKDDMQKDLLEAGIYIGGLPSVNLELLSKTIIALPRSAEDISKDKIESGDKYQLARKLIEVHSKDSKLISEILELIKEKAKISR